VTATFKTLVAGSLFGLALSLCAVPAFAGDIEFGGEAVIVQLAKTGRQSKIVDIANDWSTAVSGLASIQSIGDSEIEFHERALIAEMYDMKGKTFNISERHGLAVIGIASIQSISAQQ
jgi:hypothetical protein